jgi:Tfp pilus assembly protein PilX
VKEGTRNLLDKAARAIRAAEILVREGEREFGAGRA